MIGGVGVALGLMALAVCLPSAVLFVEILAATVVSRGRAEREGERPRVAILMPAHNEESMLGGTLRTIMPQLQSTDRLLVVADNCTDGTAGVARAHGAEVVVRADSTHVGKGYALDFGVRHLASDPPDIVIIIDADCEVAPGCIDMLARRCKATLRPVQSLYLMRAPGGARPAQRIAEFAWLVKNLVRPEGLRRLGLPCQLMGTGMAFPWVRIRDARLADGNIVEDMKLGMDLAAAGVPPLFCPDALVTSEFPTSNQGISGQRTRWEHGHLGIIIGNAPRLLRQAIVTRNGDLMALTLDLCVPPLALLCLTVAGTGAATACFGWATGIMTPLAISVIAAALIGTSIFLSWFRHARRIVSLRDLAFAVAYAARKIPLYARFLFARQSRWVRAKRDAEK